MRFGLVHAAGTHAMEQQQQQHQLLEVKVEVAVQRPAWLRQQQVLRQFASSGAVTCSAVVSALQQEFGPGNLCDDDDVVYLPTVQLQPGNAYVYKVFRNRGQRQGMTGCGERCRELPTAS